MPRFRMQERDLDLILLEELLSETGFGEWFGQKVGLDTCKVVDAEHSVSAKANAKWGETDVLAIYANGDEKVAVLIEDKIAADFTDKQASRYRERADDIVASGKAARGVIVLVAPQEYLARVPTDDPWDCRIPIEDIGLWFSKHTGSHYAWRAAALEQCVERVRRNQSADQKQVRRFSEQLAELLRSEPSGRFSHKPTGEKWFVVASPLTPAYVGLAWKPGLNLVDLTFDNRNAAPALDVAPPPGVIKRLGSGTPPKSVMFGIRVPAVDVTQRLDEQMDVVRAVVEAFDRLLPLVPKVLGTQTRT